MSSHATCGNPCFSTHIHICEKMLYYYFRQMNMNIKNNHNIQWIQWCSQPGIMPQKWTTPCYDEFWIRIRFVYFCKIEFLVWNIKKPQLKPKAAICCFVQFLRQPVWYVKALKILIKNSTFWLIFRRLCDVIWNGDESKWETFQKCLKPGFKGLKPIIMDGVL